MNYFKYFSEIEATFIRRRGRNLLLSPLDWALIESWQERGVPLRIVLRGIATVFDAHDQNPKRQPVKSLTYCRDEIEAQFAAWQDSQVGKDSNSGSPSEENHADRKPIENRLFSDQAIAAHILKITDELARAEKNATGELKQILNKIRLYLRKMAVDSHPPEELEKILEKCDDRIAEGLSRAFVSEKMKADTLKQISSYERKMEKEVFERTFNLMLLKSLREEKGIPRLSLFDL